MKPVVKEEGRKRRKEKEVVTLEVSLRHLRDRTFLFPACLMICHQRRHLESTLNQFISFVFNHPGLERSDATSASTVSEETTPRRWGPKEIAGKSFDLRGNISPSTTGVLRLFSLASWLNNPTAFQGACCFEITLRDYIPTISVILITRTSYPLPPSSSLVMNKFLMQNTESRFE